MPTAHKHSLSTIGVIDIFAGPGGLGEGFSSFTSSSAKHPFDVVASAEMEAAAHATLRLRTFMRLVEVKSGSIPRAYYDYLGRIANGEAERPSECFGKGVWSSLWKEAETRAMNLTLGQEADNRQLHNRIRDVRRVYDEIVLIGGPPCQAYSLVGRARQRNVDGFRTKGTSKHFLYRQYLRILADFAPAVFVMENVKGILTSVVGGSEMFKAITKDLSDPAVAVGGPTRNGVGIHRYVLLPVHIGCDQLRTSDLITDHPERLVVRCERHGVPQARHRVIIMGVRDDLMHSGIARIPGFAVKDNASLSVGEALQGLPKLRSGVSRQIDDANRWQEVLIRERARLSRELRSVLPDVAARIADIRPAHRLPRMSSRYSAGTSRFAKHLRDPKQAVVLNHETRGHMESDLARYLFCAAFAKERGRSPTAEDFPWQVAPNHQNWGTGAFSDRFRVQLRGRPSSTVTSHLSKDGHAFIHWDPNQCRSLTVREAARLQTFPDNYAFLGTRTQQYVQVGNAVPPLIAEQIARVVWQVFAGA